MAVGGPGGALAQLAWLVAAGADEALDAAPRDRFHDVSVDAPGRGGAANTAPPQHHVPATQMPASGAVSGAPAVHAQATARLIEDAARLAEAADTLDALKDAVQGFDGCALKQTATTTVFADGNANAEIMLIGEAPGAEEDRRGLPFVGAAGQLLDRMLAAIGRDRGSAYITNVLFWRPPGNRAPTPEELALCRPFVDRHIALVAPRAVLCLGGIAAKSLLDRREGITRLRGRWFRLANPYRDAPVDCLATFHPAFLLRQPAQKRLAWRDLMAVESALQEADSAP